MVLKKTREKGIRTWDEDDNERIVAGAMSYLKLNRPIKAGKLFSIVLKKGASKEMGEFCLRQIDELKK